MSASRRITSTRPIDIFITYVVTYVVTMAFIVLVCWAAGILPRPVHNFTSRIPERSVPQAPPAPITDLRCTEDMGCWSCSTMGNGLCKTPPTVQGAGQ